VEKTIDLQQLAEMVTSKHGARMKRSHKKEFREFIAGVVIIPTIFSIIWLAVFSAIALTTVQGWSIENVQQL
jgi:choline-glycine betaine transporter